MIIKGKKIYVHPIDFRKDELYELQKITKGNIEKKEDHYVFPNGEEAYEGDLYVIGEPYIIIKKGSKEEKLFK